MMVNNNNLVINKHPELLAEWDYDRNNEICINVNTITCGSHRKAWWRCTVCKGSYLMEIKNKTNGQKCPFCSGRKVLKGYNDLLTLYPDLIHNEWDYEKNNFNNIHPDELTKGSAVKAHWKCDICKGSYIMAIYSRTGNRGCPYCSGQRVLQGYNDLASQYPELVNSEWDWNKNTSVKPSELTIGSNRKVNWKCSVCNGSYEMKVADRTLNSRGCPYCAGQRVLPGFNDLESCYPELMKDWNYEKNKIKPCEIAKHSKTKAWWRCSKCKHEWLTSIGHRTLDGTGCPVCSQRISKQENQVAEFIDDYLCLHYNSSFTMNRSIKFKRIYEMYNIDTDSISDELQPHLMKELDIYIPELSFAVEYDGDYWHNDEIMLRNKGITNDEAHVIKHKLCKQANITLLFVTEHDWLNDNGNVKNNLAYIIDSQMK